MNVGRMDGKYAGPGGIGRKKYYCTHPDRPENDFIGFGVCTYESPIAIKTAPRWCPKRKKHNRRRSKWQTIRLKKW